MANETGLRRRLMAALVAGAFAGFAVLSGCGDSGSGADIGHDADADASPPTCGGGYFDPATTLCWQDPLPGGVVFDWDGALTYCAGLSLAGHGRGSWRLPTIGELRSLVRGCPAIETGGACGVTDACLGDGCRNDSCEGCEYLGGPGAGGAYWPAGFSGPASWYWSSSAHADDPSQAWAVYFGQGYVAGRDKTYPAQFRCVRRGP
ncbi:MAG: DUF1566 domain-containing protein [Myxococcota bacterium]|nr:DUF1566 domain-containing protein [Myxococcota bacterium]